MIEYYAVASMFLCSTSVCAKRAPMEIKAPLY